MSLGDNPDWDLSLAFESGLQILVKTLGSFGQFKILFHNIVYSSNYVLHFQEKMNLPVGASSVRLENSGTLHHGQAKFVFFEIEHQKALFVENDFSMMPSIEGGRTLSEGRVYPSDPFDTQTLSLLLTDQDSVEERLSIAEVLEDETLQQ